MKLTYALILLAVCLGGGLTPFCNSYDTNQTCQSCDIRYYLNNALCTRCSSNCLQCSTASASSCSTCEDGYYINDDGSGCTAACAHGCRQCTSTICIFCLDGFFPNDTNDNTLCAPCTGAYSNCQESGLRNPCIRGFYQPFALTCAYCSKSCKECS